MSKEFHVFTHFNPDYEQAFVFEVERDIKDESIVFSDLLMVTNTRHGELRTRIKFDDMIQSIISTEGGNIEDSNVKFVVDMFKDLIPEEKQDEIINEISEREIYSMDPNKLIMATESILLMEQMEQDIKNERDNDETNRGTSQKT